MSYFWNKLLFSPCWFNSNHTKVWCEPSSLCTMSPQAISNNTLHKLLSLMNFISSSFSMRCCVFYRVFDYLSHLSSLCYLVTSIVSCWCFLFVSIFTKTVVAHKIGPWYNQHHSVEKHFCNFKSFLQLWGDYPARTHI